MQIVHRSDLVGKLFVHRLRRAAPFADVPFESAGEAGVQFACMDRKAIS